MLFILIGATISWIFLLYREADARTRDPALQEWFGVRTGNTSSQTLPDFGFIMPRCVRMELHNELWRENYRCLRALFPKAPIVIIDDHSNTTLVDQGFNMTNAVVVPSKLPPGKGEALPYLYFHKHKPFRKAVMLNDGMFILQREPLWSALQNTSDYRFLWHFDSVSLQYDLEAQHFLISTLCPETQDQLRALQGNSEQWAASFASAVIMTWDFLDHLNATYGFVSMLSAVEGRDHRKGLERVVGLTCIDATGRRPASQLSVYGDIHAHMKPFNYFWYEYMRQKATGALSNVTAVKVWNGR